MEQVIEQFKSLGYEVTIEEKNKVLRVTQKSAVPEFSVYEEITFSDTSIPWVVDSVRDTLRSRFEIVAFEGLKRSDLDNNVKDLLQKEFRQSRELTEQWLKGILEEIR